MLSSPRWNKVWRDLLANKTRTMLVVLSIAVGVFAFGMIAGTRTTLLREVNQGYMAANPASATLHIDPFDDALVDAVARMPEVQEAEGRRNVVARVSIGEGEWYDIVIRAIADFDDLRVNIPEPEAGVWPPPDKTILLERSSLPLINAFIGKHLLIELPNGKTRELPMVGLAYDVSSPPGEIAGVASAYVTRETLSWLGTSDDFDQLLFTVAENKFDEAHIQTVAAIVQDKVERSGRELYAIDVPTPGQHPAEEILPTILLILSILGTFSLVLSGFLVINTVSAILSQQTRQIGIMKSMGARPGDLIRLYFGMVFAFGLLALLIAVPLGALGATTLSRFMSGLLNIDLQSTHLPLEVLLLEIFIGLLVPFLASLQPILGASRITIREAMTDYGLGSAQYGDNFIDRLLKQIRGLPRPLMISLRNTFRRKARLLRTLITLTLGGAIFISVLTVRASLFRTLNETIDQQGYDVQVNLSRPYRIERLQQEVETLQGVTVVEGWGSMSTRRQRPNGTESDLVLLEAPPITSQIISPDVTQGNWLSPDREGQIVVSSRFLSDESDLELGSQLVLDIDGEEHSWEIVGTTDEFQPPVAPPKVYITFSEYAHLKGQVGRTNNVRIVTQKHDPESHQAIAQALESHFEQVGLSINTTKTTSEDRVSITQRFNILTTLLLSMSILVAIVGAIGLMGTMSINVIERTREIGVMRAIGASNRAIMRIVLVEGTLIGMMAWTVGFLLSLPMSRLMSNQIGLALLRLPLFYTFSVEGTFLWLLITVVLATSASFLPARNASRLTIREVLSYE